MIGQSSVFKFGRLYLLEIERLVAEGRMSPSEVAAIFAQTDQLNAAAIRAITDQVDHPNLLAPLARLADHRRIELLLMRGVSPRVVREIRKRRYSSYRAVLHVAKEDFEVASRQIRTQYADASEWPSFAKEERRLLRAEWLFARLWIAGVKYRLGFRTDMKRLTDQIAALLVDLPNRRDCIA